jgi:hypothetical protein|tara:strand:+ start:6149 stop:6373 length:225 start_codon:yes stop_codon:yes gene_type:complete
MNEHTLDLHGVRHYEVDLKVENFIFMNQDKFPLTIICGNSKKMIDLVLVILNKHSSSFREGEGFDYGKFTIYKL